MTSLKIQVLAGSWRDFAERRRQLSLPSMMKIIGHVLLLLAALLEIAGSQERVETRIVETSGTRGTETPKGAEVASATKVYLKRAIGHLRIVSSPSADTYEVYFHVPVPFEDHVTWMSHLSSGIYFYRLRARPTAAGQPGDFVETKKMLLVK